MATALVLANGERPPEALLARRVAEADLFVCVDGAAAAALLAGLTPDLVVGDMDSLAPGARAWLTGSTTELVELVEQDTTDLEKAFYTLADRAVSEVLVLGAGGRRWDHFLVNLMTFARYADRLVIRAEDEFGTLTMLAPGPVHTLDLQVGERFSLLPLPSAAGVATTGMHWTPAPTLAMDGAQGISNVVDAVPVTLRYAAGSLALYQLSKRPSRA